MATDVPFPDSYWVIPGRLLAGEYPGATEELAARRKLRALIRAGVDVCVDLTEPGELAPYAPWLQEEGEEYGKVIEIYRFPVPDFTAPAVELTRQVLERIDLALEQGQVVYVHCWGGIGRTGTIIGCYLVRHGMNGAQAVAEIARLRQATPDGMYPSPESAEQLKRIMDWAPGQ
ncbi:MAG TPA: dual specificity protein phosphatase family protein [Anaerolineaceae bacterium]|nr:dual specificity protein phosphatase family protein [Anaerolineaceae bacterium]